MIFKQLANPMDFLKPALYIAEKAVAANSIPSIVDIPNRKKLVDFDPVTVDEFDHSLWDGILQKYIVDTEGIIEDITGVHMVDYTSLSKDGNFYTYLGLLEKADVESLSPPEQLAFWMNSYNALCISHIVNNMEKIKGSNGKYSINNLSSSGNPVWDQEAGIIGGKTMSLNDIEHKELRGKWAEPAVHACIVCASASCPNLRKQAFVGSAVGDQMKDQMKQWMKNGSKGISLKGGGRKLFLSRIFLWFADDFGGWNGLREWLPQFLEDGEVKTSIETNRASVRYFDYNWQTNLKFEG